MRKSLALLLLLISLFVGASLVPATQNSNSNSNSTQSDKGNPETKVWVNKSSHVYHCPGTRYYGQTKNGEYMTQKSAQDAGNRAAYGKVCK